jgi:HEAT repeat protein
MDDNGQFVLISKSAKSNKKSVDPTVRIFAIEDLVENGFEASQVVTLLSTALDDSNSNIRWPAASALCKIGPNAKIAVPMPKESLHDSEAIVLINAVEAIGKIRPEYNEEVISAMILRRYMKIIAVLQLTK